MEEERGEWMNFLQQRDTLHLIVDIGEEPRSYAELKEWATIEKSALSNRLKTGRRLDVWQKTLVETDGGGDEEVYELLRGGQRVFDQLQKMDAVEASKRAREHFDVVFNAREMLVDRLRSDE